MLARNFKFNFIEIGFCTLKNWKFEDSYSTQHLYQFQYYFPNKTQIKLQSQYIFMTLNQNSGFHWKFYNKIQFSPQCVIPQHEIKFFYCLLQWPSRSVTRRRQVPKIRSSAFSFGQRHYELHASNEVYVCQCRLSRNNSFRSCCQENEAKLTWNVICFLSPFLLKGCAIVPLAQIDFDFFAFVCYQPYYPNLQKERRKNDAVICWITHLVKMSCYTKTD